MPIPVACTCGARFAANDQLAGKTVKCPKCQSPLTIPAASAAPAMSAPAPFPGPSAPAPFPGAAGPMPSQDTSLFDQAGLNAAPAGTFPCPGCSAPLNPGAVVCIKCGYNLKLGRRMGTVNLDRPEAGAHDAHGGAAAAMLAKAEAAIDEEREYEASKGTEGMPWWGYFLILMGLLGFTVLMLTLPTATAMNAAGWTLVLACSALNFYYGVRLLMIAFEESATQGILCFIGIYQLYYIFSRWDKCGGLFIRSMMVGVVAILGYVMVIIANMPAST